MSNGFLRMGNLLINIDDTSVIIGKGKNIAIYKKDDYDGVGIIPINKTLDELLEILNAKEQPVDWIPISERLPKEKQECLVCRNGTIQMDKFIGHDIPYKWDLTISDYEAWMPLPDPYKGE